MLKVWLQNGTRGHMSGCSQLCRASPDTSTALGSPVSQKDLSAPHIPAAQQAPSPLWGEGGTAPLRQGQLRAGIGPLAAAGRADTAPTCCLRSPHPMLSSSWFQIGNHTDTAAGTLRTNCKDQYKQRPVAAVTTPVQRSLSANKLQARPASCGL